MSDCEEKDKEIKNLKDIRNAFLEEKKQEFISAAIDYVNEKEEMCKFIYLFQNKLKCKMV